MRDLRTTTDAGRPQRRMSSLSRRFSLPERQSRTRTIRNTPAIDAWTTEVTKEASVECYSKGVVRLQWFVRFHAHRAYALDPKTAEALWKKSEELVGGHF